MRRKKLTRSKSKKAFRRGVTRQHPKNRADSYWMRGGIRL